MPYCGKTSTKEIKLLQLVTQGNVLEELVETGGVEVKDQRQTETSLFGGGILSQPDIISAWM